MSDSGAHQRNLNVEYLASLVDWDDEGDGEYRFLVDGKDVKYVTVAPGSLPKDDRTFAPVFLPLLPEFPPGDWNEGHVSKDEHTGQLIFSKTTLRKLPGVKNIWHPIKIDHLELKKLSRLRQNIHTVSHPLFSRPLIVKFAEFPWQTPCLESETTAYQWIDGRGIGPRFLGHVTEAGRTIGFLMELVDGARTADLDDLAACQGALARLHALGIKHGDINKYNFLVGDQDVVMIDFETAKQCEDKEELEEEHRQLAESLRSESTRGGVGESFSA